MKFNKRGFNLGSNAMRVVYAFLGIVLLLILAGELLPVTIDAVTDLGGNMTASGVPLAGLFSAGGVVALIIVIVIVVAVIKNASSMSK